MQQIGTSPKDHLRQLRVDNLALQGKVERRLARLKQELLSCFDLLAQTDCNSQRDALYFADVIESETGRHSAMGNAYQISHSPSIAAGRHTPDPFSSGCLVVVNTRLSRGSEQVSPSPTLASDVVLLATPLNSDEKVMYNLGRIFPLRLSFQWSPSDDNIFISVLRAVAKRISEGTGSADTNETSSDLLDVVRHFTFRHWGIVAAALENQTVQWGVPTLEAFTRSNSCNQSLEEAVDQSWDSMEATLDIIRREWGQLATLSASCCHHRWITAIQPALEHTRILSTGTPSTVDTGAVLGQMAQLFHSWEGLNWSPQEDTLIAEALRDRAKFVTSRCVWSRVAAKLTAKGRAVWQSHAVKGISKQCPTDAPRYKSEFHALHETFRAKDSNGSVGHSVFAVVSRFQRVLNPFHCGASALFHQRPSKILNDMMSLPRTVGQCDDGPLDGWSVAPSSEEDDRIRWAFNNAISLGRPAYADDLWLQLSLNSLALCAEDPQLSVLPLYSTRCSLRSEAYVEGRLHELLSKTAEIPNPLEHGCALPLSRRPISGVLFATPPSSALRSADVPRRLLEQFSDAVMHLLMIMSRKVVEKLPLTAAHGKDVTSFLQHFVMEGRATHARVSLHVVQQQRSVVDLLRSCPFFFADSTGIGKALCKMKRAPKRPRGENCATQFEWREDVNAILLYFVELYQEAYGKDCNLLPSSSRSLTEVKRLWHNVARCVTDYWQDSCDDVTNSRVSQKECIQQWKLLICRTDAPK